MSRLQEWSIIMLKQLIEDIEKEKVTVTKIEDIPEQDINLAQRTEHIPAVTSLSYVKNK